MRRAIAAAGDACARPFPNPYVGCVLLDASGNEIAIGVHRGAGTPHAEVDALRQAGDRASGGTAVVSLEPCNHTGRTGPCSQALIEAHVARVIYAQTDPNPQARGGADTLRAAGVNVEGGVLAAEATHLNSVWTHSISKGRPFVTWKYAATLDGRSAAADGTSQWITSTESRRDVQTLRAHCDAIMVGTGTVIADNPRLTLRDDNDKPLPFAEQPLRVIAGTSAVPEGLQIWSDEAPTLQIRAASPYAILQALDGGSIRHVWLEGGPRLAGAFADAGLIDRIVGYIAPAVLGAGHNAIAGAAATLGDRHQFEFTDIRAIGPDIRVMATRAEGTD